MAKFIDYYKILGVAKDTPQSEIKAAYRKRSKQFHPDLHPDDPKAKAKFQLLNEAYDVLSDSDKRARYDQYGEQWDKVGAGQGGYGGQYQGNPFGGFEFNMGGAGGFSDFFSELFGSMGRGAHAQANPFSGFGQTARQQSPQVSQATVDLDMYTAILGGDVIIQAGDSKLKLKVKPGTQPGTKVKLKGKGQGGMDLVLTYNVVLPVNLSDRQKQLLTQMRQG